MPDLMTTGEFSARSNLTVKALRLYDTKGLLPPAQVDPRTGFRRYSRPQLALARRITLLRAIGMPLAEVGRVLRLTGPEAAQAVAEYWGRREAEWRAQQSVLAYIRGVFLEEGAGAYEVRERDVPEQRVISVQGHVDAASLAGFITAASATLFGHLSAAGGCLSGPPFAVFHGTVSQDSHGPVEVCVPTDSPIEPAGRIGLRLEPAHREAYIMVAKERCGHPAILPVYDALRVWLDDRDLPQCLSAREIYHPNWDTAGPAEHVADVAFPFGTVSRSERSRRRRAAG
ncbi:MerR family transcriptional regulator [Nonomuraea rhodomycinica]|uniref:MerR family transcriptional regulator n=1 Tax=Nonomuraea rhodomycinica TaxID=1712872 RepID=A0A7Y6IRQ6_9ACTN|nr:MerR family transcriptional regulator [Nonomuraea rhodomycinica]NUW42853.1 MerR family transcriptional regulator [Nonomuraea rhodomycinica]